MPIQSTISFVPTKPAPEEASSGCTTPGRSSQLDRPDMVSPTTDDLRRRALSDWPISDVVNPREKRGHSVGSDSSANQSDGSVARKSKIAKMENYPSGEDLSLPNAVQSSSRVTIDSPLAGSEDDHQKVKKTSRNLDANEKACLLAYYGEPFYLKTEVSICRISFLRSRCQPSVPK
ncbi:uncharacterized protein MELLADRAFT_112381 [Melampsora larici-populina 98AG31]|uniref:Uncharacterized protein n=1 Tax=Melampsora larici-populina (strain 98AG31 / pathotype 3-4-7) TaxID=747676 RepID=F4S6A8_MELLP|nr:uncharacterized protein MELLADRAFT_112381 [Melampsora larici-populina 98AG31]EGF99781.1 hypothetical protein MELLADRAFT_112381 [Melampsora larici-populina 98AG31]